MAVGPVTDHVEWYAVVVQLPGGEAFVARPAAKPGRASTRVAMLELGAHLTPIPFDRLETNADIDAVRQELGRRIGIEDNLHEAPQGSLHSSLEANLGHAMFLCFQGQSEIANRTFLFHRQGEPGIAEAIRDTLPYFLGAVPRNQGVLRQGLSDARRQLRRAEEELGRARASNEDVEAQLRGLSTEAITLGLLPSEFEGGRAELREALGGVALTEPRRLVGDDQLAVRRVQLDVRRSELRGGLRAIGEQIALLDALQTSGGEYGTVVTRQVSRLRSIDLLGTPDTDDDSCPVCGSRLKELDPTVSELRREAVQLQTQLQSMDSALPARRDATERLQLEADALRQELLGIDAAIHGLDTDQYAAGEPRRLEEQQLFFRGRLQQYLATSLSPESETLRDLEERVRLRGLAVSDIESQLDPEEERDQVESRLAVVGADMTRWAGRLDLEYRTRVRLDLRRLTVVTDTSSGPMPLFRIGSAENWVGYHLISHLALHRYFVREGRPTPRLLMLDQLTQAYYPSDVEQVSGVPTADDDRQAVQRMYELMRDVSLELAPSLQIIVCDHANLPDEWFQEAVVENWREGRKLVPESWIGSANQGER
jgi:hypothetical protein